MQLPVAPPLWGLRPPHRAFGATSLPRHAVVLARATRLRRRHAKTRAAGRAASSPRRAEETRTYGVVAQLGERLDGIEKVAGAIPADSTN